MVNLNSITSNIKEIIEYAKYIGIDPVKDKELLYIAKDGL